MILARLASLAVLSGVGLVSCVDPYYGYYPPGGYVAPVGAVASSVCLTPATYAYQPTWVGYPTYGYLGAAYLTQPCAYPSYHHRRSFWGRDCDRPSYQVNNYYAPSTPSPQQVVQYQRPVFGSSSASMRSSLPTRVAAPPSRSLFATSSPSAATSRSGGNFIGSSPPMNFSVRSSLSSMRSSSPVSRSPAPAAEVGAPTASPAFSSGPVGFGSSSREQVRQSLSRFGR